MAKDAPNAMELASRDVVSRAEWKEIADGQGVDGCVLLDLTHLGAEEDQDAAARLPRAGARLRRRRLHRRADPGAPRRPLPDGRRRRGRVGRDHRARPVGRRRGRLRVGARRQPPRRQLADGDRSRSAAAPGRPPRSGCARTATPAPASTPPCCADEDRRIAAHPQRRRRARARGSCATGWPRRCTTRPACSAPTRRCEEARETVTELREQAQLAAPRRPRRALQHRPHLRARAADRCSSAPTAS